MEDLQRFDIKILVEKNDGLSPRDFIPVLQRWIQEHSLSGTLIDVADYTHMHRGPGVILIGHEANLSIDCMDGRMGLLYHRKQPMEGDFAERVRTAIEISLDACKKLEEEFEGRLTFRTDRFLFIANDRLIAPSPDGIPEDLEASLRQIAQSLPNRPAIQIKGQTTN